MLEKIFSIKNMTNKKGEIHKVITFMGIKISILHSKKMIIKLKNNIESLQQQNNALLLRIMNLEYVLSSVGDPTKCKPATGGLRVLQKVNGKVLECVIKILEKHNIDYWLDYGTLLGALRHKGFIPWDDDIDISTTREGYEKAKEVLTKELEGTDFCVDIGGHGRTYLLRIIDRNSKLYFVDIFPYDTINNIKKLSDVEIKENWTIARSMYQKQFPLKDLRSGKIKIEETYQGMYELYQKKELPVDIQNGKYLVRGLDSATLTESPQIHEIDEVFPLKKIQFENFDACVPNKIEEYLNKCDDGEYGDIWALPDLSKYKLHLVSKTLNDPSHVEYLEKKLEQAEQVLMKYN